MRSGITEETITNYEWRMKGISPTDNFGDDKKVPSLRGATRRGNPEKWSFGVMLTLERSEGEVSASVNVERKQNEK